jgi:hypothetical protein
MKHWRSEPAGRPVTQSLLILEENWHASDQFGRISKFSNVGFIDQLDFKAAVGAAGIAAGFGVRSNACMTRINYVRKSGTATFL